MLKKMAVIGLTAGALLLAAPSVASASPVDTPTPSPNTYAETPRVSVGDPVIETCEVSTITFGAGYFLPGERVNISVSGWNAAEATVSGNVASGDGGMVVSFRPPSDGEGNYSLSFASAVPGNASAASTVVGGGYTATITVHDGGTVSCGQDPNPAPAGTELPLTGSTDPGMELALTGGSVSPWILGGGALALTAGGVLFAAGAARRRRS